MTDEISTNINKNALLEFGINIETSAKKFGISTEDYRKMIIGMSGLAFKVHKNGSILATKDSPFGDNGGTFLKKMGVHVVTSPKNHKYQGFVIPNESDFNKKIISMLSSPVFRRDISRFRGGIGVSVDEKEHDDGAYSYLSKFEESYNDALKEDEENAKKATSVKKDIAASAKKMNMSVENYEKIIKGMACIAYKVHKNGSILATKDNNTPFGDNSGDFLKDAGANVINPPKNQKHQGFLIPKSKENEEIIALLTSADFMRNLKNYRNSLGISVNETEPRGGSYTNLSKFEESYEYALKEDIMRKKNSNNNRR